MERFPVIIKYPANVVAKVLNWRKRRKLRHQLTRHAKIGTIMHALMTERSKLDEEILSAVGDQAESIRLPDINAFVVLPDKDPLWDENKLIAALGIDGNEFRNVMFWNEVEVTTTFRYPGPKGLNQLMSNVREFVQKMNGTIHDDSIDIRFAVNEAQVNRYCADHQLPFPHSARRTKKYISWRARPNAEPKQPPS